jgi:hypothetical protein
MEKQTKILLGLGAIIAAYLILKPKKAAAQTDLVTKKLDIDSLERVPSPDDTPEMIYGATRRTYKDKDGVIYKYTWSSAYPPRGKYFDTNGNEWDDNGNPISLKKSPTSDDGSVIIDNNDGYIPKSPYMPEVIIQQDKAMELQILSLLQRSREQQERRNYLIAEANRPDNQPNWA